MNRVALALSVALLVTGGCGDEQKAGRDHAGHSAETKTAAKSDNPFVESEEGMHRDMMAATGPTLSDTWARKMIAHHRGAIEMSEVLLKIDPGSEFVPMAREMIAMQSKEIAAMERMLEDNLGSSPADGTAEQQAPDTHAAH